MGKEYIRNTKENRCLAHALYRQQKEIWRPSNTSFNITASSTRTNNELIRMEFEDKLIWEKY